MGSASQEIACSIDDRICNERDMRAALQAKIERLGGITSRLATRKKTAFPALPGNVGRRPLSQSLVEEHSFEYVSDTLGSLGKKVLALENIARRIDHKIVDHSSRTRSVVEIERQPVK